MAWACTWAHHLLCPLPHPIHVIHYRATLQRCLLFLASSVVWLSACGLEITLTEDQHPGILFIELVDQSGECAKPVRLEFHFPDGSVSRATHGDPCEFGTSGPPGEWEVRIPQPQAFRFWEEDDPFLIALDKDEVRRVRVTLEHAIPSP